MSEVCSPNVLTCIFINTHRPKSINVKGLYSCGDSTFPGIGVPAVAASGANGTLRLGGRMISPSFCFLSNAISYPQTAANTIVPFWKHYGMLTQLINE